MPLYVHEARPSWLDRVALCASLAIASGVGIAVSQLITLHYYRKLCAREAAAPTQTPSGVHAEVVQLQQQQQQPPRQHTLPYCVSEQSAPSPLQAGSPVSSPLHRSRFHPLHVPGTTGSNTSSTHNVVSAVGSPAQDIFTNNDTTTTTATAAAVVKSMPHLPAALTESTLANVYEHMHTSTSQPECAATPRLIPRPLVRRNTLAQSTMPRDAAPGAVGAVAAEAAAAMPETPMPIYRIVITGGPCSGKTCGMTYLKKELEALGFTVYCVPEVATMLMTGGVQLWMTPEEQAREHRKVLQTMRRQKAMAEYEKALQSVPELSRFGHVSQVQNRNRTNRARRTGSVEEEEEEGEEEMPSLMSPKSLHSPRATASQAQQRQQRSTQKDVNSVLQQREGDANDEEEDAVWNVERHEAEEKNAREAAPLARTLSAASLSAMKITIQRVVLQMMLMLEDCFYELAAMRARPTVLLFDRGTMDGSAYCTEAEWQTILAQSGFTNEELRDGRYDAVVHFVTAALGAEAHYTLANNAVRHEAAEEAITVDAATRNAWRGHFLMEVIDNSTNFERKLERAAEFIRKVIGAAPRTTAPTRKAHATVPSPTHTTNTTKTEEEEEEEEEVCSPAMQELTFLMTGTRGHGCGVYASRASSRRPALPLREEGGKEEDAEDAEERDVVHEVYALDEYRSRPYVFSPSRARDEYEEEEEIGTDHTNEEKKTQEATFTPDEPRLSAGTNGSYEPEPQQPNNHDNNNNNTVTTNTSSEPEAVSPSATRTTPSPSQATKVTATTSHLHQRHKAPATTMSVAVRARSWSAAAKDGLQRYFLVTHVDLAALPQDAMGYRITVIHLRPAAQTIYAESIVRQVRCAHKTTGAASEACEEEGRPLYLHRVEYEPAMDDMEMDQARRLTHTGRINNNNDSTNNNRAARPTRCTTTRAITKERFVALAARCDPRQPLVSKTTRRFLHHMRHLTLVTFEQPEALRGVSRLVGPADMSLEELPAWIAVDAELSMTGSELLM